MHHVPIKVTRIFGDGGVLKAYSFETQTRRIIMKRYHKIVLRGIYYIFMGEFTDESEVPSVNCAYIYNEQLIFNTVYRANIPQESKASKIKMPEGRLTGDDTILKLSINNDDDYLMVLMKTLLMKKNVTVGEFKSLYGEERKTDMNNDKSRLENKNTLSWNKFSYLLHLLGHEFALDIYEKDEDKQ